MSDPGLGGGPSRAVRLTFTFDVDGVTLVDRQLLDVVVPPSDEVPMAEDPRGFWIELRSVGEEVLHRRVMPEPWRQDAEVFSPDQSIARVPVDRPSGTFSVLLPAPEDADHVVLVSASRPGLPTVTARDVERPVEVARFPLWPEERAS